MATTTVTVTVTVTMATRTIVAKKTGEIGVDR